MSEVKRVSELEANEVSLVGRPAIRRTFLIKKSEGTMEKAETKVAETEVAETEVAETEVAETEVAETEVAETEVEETEVEETEVEETEVEETEVAETEVAETEVAETEVVEKKMITVDAVDYVELQKSQSKLSPAEVGIVAIAHYKENYAWDDKTNESCDWAITKMIELLGTEKIEKSKVLKADKPSVLTMNKDALKMLISKSQKTKISEPTIPEVVQKAIAEAVEEMKSANSAMLAEIKKAASELTVHNEIAQPNSGNETEVIKKKQGNIWRSVVLG